MPTRRRRFRARPKPQPKRPPANDSIRVPAVRLVGTDGTQRGIVPTHEARAIAAEAGLDLVIVAEKADPPVARIIDLGKYLYEQRKKVAKQKTKSKSGEVKGVRLGFKMGEHDWQLRIDQAAQFLGEGNKVRLEMRLRGREKERLSQAEGKLRKFIAALSGAKIEDDVTRSPRGMAVLLTR